MERAQYLHGDGGLGNPCLTDLLGGLESGWQQFAKNIRVCWCNKGEGLGPFNIAVYWKRKYRQKGPKEPWYVLTNLPIRLNKPLAVYRCRWGIEQFFKDCKSGGYHLEDTQVNDVRFLALVLLIAIFLRIGPWPSHIA